MNNVTHLINQAERGERRMTMELDTILCGDSMDNVSFAIKEENLICIYHKHNRRRTIAAISDAK